MTITEVMNELQKMGDEQTKKTLMKHGAKEPFFGVRVGDMKKLQKKIRKDHSLAIELFRTGNSDAMYFAAMICEPEKMTKEDLQYWAEKAYWYWLSEYTVAWTAAESGKGWEMAEKWIHSPEENIASSGWSTYSSLLAITPDENIPADLIMSLLNKIENEIHRERNRVRYCMNQFLIAVGTYYLPLKAKAIEVGKKIGKISVDMGGTACKVPDAVEYIEKVEKMGRSGKKRNTAFC